MLVRFIQQRPGALIDKITVHTDGYGLFDRPSGGVGRVLRDVVVDPGVLRRMRTGPRRPPARQGRQGRRLAGAPTARPTSSATAAARSSPARAPSRRRSASRCRLLAGTLVGDGIRKYTRERLGGVAGSTHLSGIGKEKKAPTLVFCQRQGEGGATLDAITVRRDGTATLEKRHGGAGGRFKEQILRKGELPKLERALAALPPGSSLTRGSPPPGGAQFILRHRGRTQTARRRAGSSRERGPRCRLLDDLINGIGIRQTTRERATHTY